MTVLSLSDRPEPLDSTEPWRCPEVNAGDTVAFWRHGTAEGAYEPAVVTRVNTEGDGNIIVSTITRGNSYLNPIDATILHVDDPRLEDNPSLARNGVWDIRPKDRMRDRIVERCCEMMDRVFVILEHLEDDVVEAE